MFRLQKPSVDGEGEWCHVTHLVVSCFFGMWGRVGRAMRGERTHRSDVLCGRWRIKQTAGDRDGKITHLSQRREERADTSGKTMTTCAHPPSLEATLITRGKKKPHKYATRCFLGCRSFIEKQSYVDAVFSSWLCRAALLIFQAWTSATSVRLHV